jgi:hypothetical protein
MENLTKQELESQKTEPVEMVLKPDGGCDTSNFTTESEQLTEDSF